MENTISSIIIVLVPVFMAIQLYNYLNPSNTKRGKELISLFKLQAQKRNGKIQKSLIFGEYLSFNLNNFNVIVDFRKAQDLYHIAFKADIPKHKSLIIELNGKVVVGVSGLKKMKTGNVLFDKEFPLNSNNESLINTIINSDLQNKLISFQKEITRINLTLYQGKLRINMLKWPDNQYELDKFLDLAFMLFNRITEP